MRFRFVFIIAIMYSCVYHDTSDLEGEEIVVDCTSVSWQNDILPIMQNSCATSGCHDGITRLDWTNYSLVKSYAQSIKSKTVDRSMPFDGTLPQHQIDQITCWVDNGAPQN